MQRKIVGLFLSLLTTFNSASADQNITYDYIIVGNGTAGAVLARKLSDNQKNKVLVLEAGINQDNDPEVLNVAGVQLVPDFNDLLFNPKYSTTYAVPVFAPLQSLVYSEGRGWGGSSKHNFTQAIRGSEFVYNTWANLSGNNLWAYNNLLPLMLALENYTPCMTVANASQRGTGGPISITQHPPITSDPMALLLQSGTNAGFIQDINDPNQSSTTGLKGLGFSAFQMYATSPTPCTVGQRSFSSNSFLPPSIVTPEGKGKGGRLLRIESNAVVSNVIFDGKKAVGVNFIYGDKPNKILKAYGKKIILCAGAVNTPAILQRSGIGDPAVLEPLGIKVRVNNPNVGANLIDQYGVQSLVVGVTDATPYLQGFINGSSSTPFPAPFAYMNDSVRRLEVVVFQAALTPFPVCLVVAWILEPKSRGSVQIVSKSPLVQPKINLNEYTDSSSPTPYEINGTDANLAVTAYYLIAHSVGASNMIFPPATAFAAPPGTVAQDAVLFQAATSGDGAFQAYHILGTTRMATSIENGVVDGNLNVFGVKNLMIADLGVAPLSPDGNPCYSAYMIGLGAAAILGVPTPPAL